MKREIYVAICLLIGLILGVFIPTDRFIDSLLIGIYSPSILIIIAGFLCIFSRKIERWFK